MKFLKGAAVALAICAASSSVARPKQAPDPSSAGAAPSDYQAVVKAWLENNLKDPDSAKIEEVRGPRVGAQLVDRGFLGHLWGDPAWWVCYKVNARNSYGGYTGYHRYLFGFVRGRIAMTLESPTSAYGGRDYPDETVENECSRVIDSNYGTPGGNPLG